jgi:hypothetical protein
MASTSATRAARGRPWSHPRRGPAPWPGRPRPTAAWTRPGRAAASTPHPRSPARPGSADADRTSTVVPAAPARSDAASAPCPGPLVPAAPVPGMAKQLARRLVSAASAVSAAFNRSSNALVEAYTMAMTRHVQYRCTHAFRARQGCSAPQISPNSREYRNSLLA